MKKVYKYRLEIKDEQTLELPEGAEILTVQSQLGMACLWALVDPERKKEKRIFRIAGTGHPIDDNKKYKYIDTFQLYGGDLIFHVFENKGIAND